MEIKSIDKHRRRIFNGATVGLIGTSIVFTALLLPEMSVGESFWLRILFGLIYTSIATALVFGISKLLRLFPVGVSSAFIGAWLVVSWCVYNILSVFAILPFSVSWPMTIATSLLISITIVMLMAVLGASVVSYPRTAGAIFLTIGVFVAVVLWTSKPAKRNDISPPARTLLTGSTTLDAPYPAAIGKFKVSSFFYGSGQDKHRAEYGARTGLITKSVDASPFVPEGWSVARTKYWGFDQTQLPINGRVWLPDGKGVFPLVMIVHGAHKMVESSDSGFAYLGELLASRGYIVVAVDENFLNYGWHRYGDFKESDIDARGWLVLQHLRLWQEWNNTKNNPFFNKVDLSRIALIGHSRGGEAIAAASAFNRMERYPRNGNILFDFNFKIRTLIALAPSDIYQPLYERTTPVAIKDVNYLLLLGTHDRQVPSTLGSRIFQRVSFSANTDTKTKEARDRQCNSEAYIKAALYISRANHSHFNAAWGIYDFPWPYRLFSNIAGQLSGDEQRQITKMYISAFLDATLKGDKKYIDLFRDYRLVQGWLPKTSYISRFQDSNFRVICNFDEDIDPQTITLSGGSIIGQNLSNWHEQDVDLHYYLPYGSRSNRVVSVSWESQNNSAPLFALNFPEKHVHLWKLKPSDMLVFSIACPSQDKPPDVRIELRDEAGRTSQVPLEQVFPLEPPLSAYLTKMSLLEEPSPVIVLQTVSIPLSRFLALNPSIDLGKLKEVDFRFDSRRSGTVLLDDIGFDQQI